MRLRLGLQGIFLVLGVQTGLSLTSPFHRRQFVQVMIGTATAGVVMPTAPAGADDITLVPVELSATGDAKKVGRWWNIESFFAKKLQQLNLSGVIPVALETTGSCSMKAEHWKVKEIWQLHNEFIPKLPKSHHGYVPNLLYPSSIDGWSSSILPNQRCTLFLTFTPLARITTQSLSMDGAIWEIPKVRGGIFIMEKNNGYHIDLYLSC